MQDVTIANSTFGNPYVPVAGPSPGVHALGGGIGRGIAMGIGAGHAGAGKAICLLHGGGAQLGLVKLATTIEARTQVAYVLMDDRAHGVIRSIRNTQYEGRGVHSAPLTPDFAQVCGSVGLPHERVDEVIACERALAAEAPALVDVDMTTIGPSAGPPDGAAQR